MEIESTDGSKDKKNLGPNNKCLKLDNVEADWYYKARSSENLEMKAFEKFENAVFFKIFKISSDRRLILVSNLTKNFFEKKFQQLRLLELSKFWAEMGCCGQADLATAKFFSSN